MKTIEETVITYLNADGRIDGFEASGLVPKNATSSSSFITVEKNGTSISDRKRIYALSASIYAPSQIKAAEAADALALTLIEMPEHAENVASVIIDTVTIYPDPDTPYHHRFMVNFRINTPL